jgi:uncharacterized protein (TIGR02145 family)
MSNISFNGKVIEFNGNRIIYNEPIQLKTVLYGYLYNYFAVADSRNITSTDDWVVPESSDFDNLITAVGSNSAYKLRETGTEHWVDSGGTNDFGFNARGSGYGGGDSFNGIKEECYFRTLTMGFFGFTSYYITYTFTDMLSNFRTEGDTGGDSVRLKKISTTLLDGDTGTYTGNDGTVYPTICIGDVEWLSCDLAETQYRNLDVIPTVTDDTTWYSLSTGSTGAKCAYNNDESYVFV